MVTPHTSEHVNIREHDLLVSPRALFAIAPNAADRELPALALA